MDARPQWRSGGGFGIDVERLGFISRDLRSAIRRLVRAPKLGATFETSVSGLHFIGPSSAMSFGPHFRFVSQPPVGRVRATRAILAHMVGGEACQTVAAQPIGAGIPDMEQVGDAAAEHQRG